MKNCERTMGCTLEVSVLFFMILLEAGEARNQNKQRPEQERTARAGPVAPEQQTGLEAGPEPGKFSRESEN